MAFTLCTMVICVDGFLPILSHYRHIMRSRGKLKLLHFQYYSAYEHQIAIAKALADFLLQITSSSY